MSDRRGADPPRQPAAPGGVRRRTSVLAAVFIGAVLACLLALVIARAPQVGRLTSRLFLPLMVALTQALAMIGLAGGLRWLLGACGLGQRRLGVAGPRGWQLATHLVLGYPLLGALLHLIGLLQVSLATMLPPLVLLAALGAASLRPGPRERARGATDGGRRAGGPREGLSVIGALALVPLVLGLTLGLLSAQLPPATLDELAYHLTIPKSWVVHGRVVELPLISHAYFPLGIESADMLPLLLLGNRGAVAVRLLHLLVAVASVGVCAGWLRRRLSLDLSLVGAAAVASVPTLLLSAGWAKNEWPLLGICLALIAALDRLTTARSRRDEAAAALALALGAGLLCKYTFVLFAAPLVAIQALLLWRDPGARRGLLAAAGVGALLGALFFVRNLVLTGNPVAPFLGADAPQVSGYHQAAGPLALTLSYIHDVTMGDEALGGTLVVLALALAVGGRTLRRERFLLASGVALAALVVLLVLLRPSSRILIPFLAGAGLIGLIGADRALAAAGARVRAWIYGGLSLLALVQLLFVGYVVHRQDPFATVEAGASDAGYLRRHRRNFPAFQWLDERLDPSTRTLVLGIQELFWLDAPVRGGGNFDGPRLARYLDRPSAAALHHRLLRDGFTHVAVFWPGVRDAAGAPGRGKSAESQLALEPRVRQLLRELLRRHAVEVDAVRPLALYRLRAAVADSHR